MTPSPAQRLRRLLATDELLLMPCCFDALSARLVENAGFQLTFLSGFAVAASRAALPDTGLLSLGEMLDQGRAVTGAVTIPVLGDGDTGHGNPVNVKRTVREFARAGFACVMIEDQEMPKRCGHVPGKRVVDRREALARVQAAVDAREEGADILVMARTDARCLSLTEALERARAFADLGADIVFLEAPESRAEMETFCRQVPGPKMANLLHGGRTPILPPAELAAMGYQLAAYPLTLLGAAVAAMEDALDRLARGETPPGVDLAGLRQLLGFAAYDREAARYPVSEA